MPMIAAPISHNARFLSLAPDAAFGLCHDLSPWGGVAVNDLSNALATDAELPAYSCHVTPCCDILQNFFFPSAPACR